ncbi:hypothetical protein [Paenibacillus endoradicis]|uniref:hypothetical protein n=1 Tax=Paenibacillus endoradicis TaxID=2972487 RepID=UPI002158F519|nr:hypothetical protein [Paenibacillus endoradicis]
MILLGVTALAGLIILVSGIPHKIDKQLSAVQFRMDDDSVVENTIITIQGSFYKRWFSDYKFEGSFIVNNYEFTKTYNKIELTLSKGEAKSAEGILYYSSSISGSPSTVFLGVITMSDDFEKISINILEPIDSDSKSTKDLWIAAPASTREEALLLWNELHY